MGKKQFTYVQSMPWLFFTILFRLEEALDGSKETSVKEIEECLVILEQMKNHIGWRERRT